jgi:peptidoglycan/LPS O-acetylase OafA/YrhL
MGIGSSRRWSLAVEEQFYLIVPLILRLLSRRVLHVLFGTTVCLAPLLRIWVHYNLHAPGSLHLILGYTVTPCR